MNSDPGILVLRAYATFPHSTFERFVHRSPYVAWDTITSHLIIVLRHPAVPQPIRLQATRTLGEILVAILRHLTSAPAMQRWVLDILAQ